jgi:hypothetical protein
MGKPIKNILTIIILYSLVSIVPVFAAIIQLPQTGQTKCYSETGSEIPCIDTGQDGEIQAGVAWPVPRFILTYCDAASPCTEQNSDCDDNASTDVIIDNLTGLMWARDANLPGYEKTWQQALDFVTALNNGNGLCGHNDWRLPNIIEIESLRNLSYGDQPGWFLDQGFIDAGPCWSSTTSTVGTLAAWVNSYYFGDIAPQGKDSRLNAWPVRSTQIVLNDNSVILLPKTGQIKCYDSFGVDINCLDTGQDGDIQTGETWPVPRYIDAQDGTVIDNLTGLIWLKDANCFGKLTWYNALRTITDFNKNPNIYNCEEYLSNVSGWHLPNIVELRSLIDYSQHNPILSINHPFVNVETNFDSIYWSSTTYSTDSAKLIV